MIGDLTSSGAMPALEAAMRFSAGRQKLLAHNIANFSTPNYQFKDVSPKNFQSLLHDAVEQRRARNGGNYGGLMMKDSREISQSRLTGQMKLTPRTSSGNIAFHDRNNRDLERTMQALVENASYFRAATDFMRQQKSQLMVAITQRV